MVSSVTQNDLQENPKGGHQCYSNDFIYRSRVVTNVTHIGAINSNRVVSGVTQNFLSFILNGGR